MKALPPGELDLSDLGYVALFLLAFIALCMLDSERRK